MRIPHAVAGVCAVLAAISPAQPLGPPIENPSEQYLVWNDYKIEINQYGDLGRNWPTPDLVWEQFSLLKAKADANPEPPNTLRAVLLVIPHIVATAVREDGTVVGERSSEMNAAEIKSALDQWRQFEEMVFVYSGGNAWLRTDIKVIDEPVEAQTNEDWVFWPGQQRELLDRYIPFERGEYQSYNSIYTSKGLNGDPHGGTIGAVGGIKGCGTSDNAFYGDGWLDFRTGYVALHEWLNQQCSATSNMMPYPDEEALWNNYVLHKIGYREDAQLDRWPWLSARRDTMTQIIRPGMWRRWSAIDPYESLAIGEWLLFGPSEATPADVAREISAAPDDEGRPVSMPMEKYTHFNLAQATGATEPPGPGTYYFRICIDSDARREVRLWAGADERFQLWLNGVMVRDGWGWTYSDDDGRLVEKAAYPTLERGVNTLVLALPNTTGPVEFRVRLCETDGSGRQPAGVTALATLRGRTPGPLAEPVVHDFAEPRFYSWAEVNDMPWTKLPRIGEAELRALTGIRTLDLVTNGSARTSPEGEVYEPPQHLFLDVPEGSVTSPRLDTPAEDAAALDNDLDFNWESMAWLRVPDRPGREKDLLLLRFDVAEPLMHLLRTRARPGQESIVGWLLEDHKLAYVLLVDLDVPGTPKSALELLMEAPRGDTHDEPER